MAAHGSRVVVIAALGFNAAIAVAKFAAAAYTGSSAMLSEAVHSVADTSNQGLLLYGMHRSEKPADAQHPFGYAKEIYFWSFLVAILLFSLGAGVSIYEGVHKLANPHPIAHPYVNYAVLSLAILLESGSTYVAVREFNIHRQGARVYETLRSSKDPALFTVLLEDVAALAGLTTALVGILVADLLGWVEADGIASLVIGFILAAVAAFIAVEVKGLLIGEAARDALVAGVRARIAAQSGAGKPVRTINDIKTMQLGPANVLVAISIDVDDDLKAAEIEAVTGRFHRAVKQDYPEIQNLYLEIRAAAQAQGAKVTDETLAAAQLLAPGGSKLSASAAMPPAPPTNPTQPRGRKKGKGKRRRH